MTLRIAATRFRKGSPRAIRQEEFDDQDVAFLRQHLRDADRDERDPFRMRAFRKLADLLEAR